MIRLLVTMQLFLTVAVARYRGANQSRDACRLERAPHAAAAVGLGERGFNIGSPIRDMIRKHETNKEGNALCQGNEGSPKGRRIYRK
jgi:hypothetical protein